MVREAREMELPLISVSSRYASKCPCCGFRARHALGSKLGAIPFFDQKKVIGLLDNPSDGRGLSRCEPPDFDDGGQSVCPSGSVLVSGLKRATPAHRNVAIRCGGDVRTVPN